MNVSPVIRRELRAAARQPFSYHLRAIAVAALLAVSLWFGLEQGFGAERGGPLFASLHRTLFFSIWLMIPILTADCISRERREGTLGLLFLTGLTGPDVIIAKGLAHAIRAATFLVAVVPVLAIPFMLGGLGRTEILVSSFLNVGAVCLALAAGLLGSAMSKTRVRAMLNAMLLSLLFLIGFFTSAGLLVWLSISPRTPNGFGYLPQLNLPNISLGGLVFCANSNDMWDRFFFRLATSRQMLFDAGQLALMSLVALLGVIFFAGRRVARLWRDAPPSARVIWLERTFCRPVLWLDFFKAWMRRRLERNPIGWLEQRTWTGRLVTWGWLAVVVALYSALITDHSSVRTYEPIQVLIAWLIMGSMALSSSGSFRRERETGVMELLLVSPMRESQIISGRLRGLWMQFLPAFCLLLAVWTYLGSIFPHEESGLAFGLFCSTFFAVPIVGLYFSLRSRTFFGAFLGTLGSAVIGPLVVARILNYIHALNTGGVTDDWALADSGKAAVMQIGIAFACWGGLHAVLRERRFPLTATV